VNNILEYLEKSVKDRKPEYLDKLMRASFYSGCVLGYEMNMNGLPIHSLSLPLAERYGLSHGQGLALVAPFYLEMVRENEKECSARLAESLNGNLNEEQFLIKLRRMLKNTGLIRPDEVIILETDIEILSERACRSRTTTANRILPMSLNMCRDLYRRIGKETYDEW
jgi:alcohol dehydrogenase class IV